MQLSGLAIIFLFLTSFRCQPEQVDHAEGPDEENVGEIQLDLCIDRPSLEVELPNSTYPDLKLELIGPTRLDTIFGSNKSRMAFQSLSEGLYSIIISTDEQPERILIDSIKVDRGKVSFVGVFQSYGYIKPIADAKINWNWTSYQVAREDMSLPGAVKGSIDLDAYRRYTGQRFDANSGNFSSLIVYEYPHFASKNHLSTPIDSLGRFALKNIEAGYYCAIAHLPSGTSRYMPGIFVKPKHASRITLNMFGTPPHGWTSTEHLAWKPEFESIE